MKSPDAELSPCPCGSGKLFGECCKPFLDGRDSPSTAEQLMRSRYTAFVLCDERYLRASWHPDSCPDEIEACQDQIRWLGLRVKRTEKGNDNDNVGLVEFVARYKVDSRGYRLHEVSRFVRYEDKWVYKDGRLIEK
ncbi:MAG: zinc chelation protein SecC [Gammaproteobacteria bacterium]|nr:MAG: zinc chelation protein SecC [Gammaproteobacteria bacterium]